jgi:hypothetical protein
MRKTANKELFLDKFQIHTDKPKMAKQTEPQHKTSQDKLTDDRHQNGGTENKLDLQTLDHWWMATACYPTPYKCPSTTTVRSESKRQPW